MVDLHSEDPHPPWPPAVLSTHLPECEAVSAAFAIVGDMKPLPMLEPASLARSAIDRNDMARGADGDLSELWQRPRVHGILAHRGYLLVASGGLLPVAEQQVPHDSTQIYLGVDDTDTHWIGIDLSDDGRAAVDASLSAQRDRDAVDFLDAPSSGIQAAEPTWLSLREIAEALSDRDVGLACELVAVGNWHRTHTHSPRNGAPTVPMRGGWVRRDPEAGSEHFPRTDPAVIMAVVHTDDDGTERILLGSNAAWPADRYSVLAGFVEPGETLENAVLREVWEEARVPCCNPRYLGSQPWPFPASLMLGFSVEAETLDFQADMVEISMLRWFTREELREQSASGAISTPGSVSIAGQLISAWLHNA